MLFVGAIAPLFILISSFSQAGKHRHYEFPGESISALRFKGFERVIRQQGDRDCGPAALKMLLNHYGENVTLERISERSNLSSMGTSLLTLKQTAAYYGLEVTGWRFSIYGLRLAPLPVITRIRGCHFVLIDRITADYLVILDPREGEVHLPVSLFTKIWDGAALVVTGSTH